MLKNITIQHNCLPLDYNECQMRKIGGTRLVECMMKDPCQWAFSYGDSYFCRNSTVKRLAN